MLRCKDKTLYTGITNDLIQRVYNHNNSKVGARYTKSRRPVKLVWSKRVKDKVTAMKLERKTKRLPKAKKEELAHRDAKKTRNVGRFSNVEVVSAILDASSSNKVKKLKISKVVDVKSKKKTKKKIKKIK